MHKPAIPPLVYSRLFPVPRSSDPTSFQAHTTRNLLPEVHAETACFYGPVNCLEAQYPGLDYANPAHRVRLGRYPWHCKLFCILDELRLSDHEIQTLCRWEGTRSAREKYEKDAGIMIRDTTWDEVEHAVYIKATVIRNGLCTGEEPDGEVRQIGEEKIKMDNELDDEEMDTLDVADMNIAEDESEDELQQSFGVELNHRLILATEARARGEEAVLDPAWEQWLKEAAERGVIPDILSSTDANPSQTIDRWGHYRWPNYEDLHTEIQSFPPRTP